MTEAPCIAVVGPANAGKTTLLHLLDEKLHARLRSVLVIKGNPDGTGRYQFYAPELRELLKAETKGKWIDATVDHISESIVNGRKNLSLALLDFGGRYNERDHRMLRLCSHYILVTRQNDNDAGIIWEEACRKDGLTCVARMRSSASGDDVGPVCDSLADPLEGVFRYDVGPGDKVNDSVLDPLVARLVTMSREDDHVPYVDLHFAERWDPVHLKDLRGQAEKLRLLAVQTGTAVIGGRAPIYAYLAAMNCVLEANTDARVFFYDPKLPIALVEIPKRRESGSLPENLLSVEWRECGEYRQLELRPLREDRFLPPIVPHSLAFCPDIGDEIGRCVQLTGAGPQWLHGTYARWLVTKGIERLRVFDAGSQTFILVWPRV